MIIIGVILLIAALVFGFDLVVENNHHLTSPAVFGQSLGFHSEAAVFLLGCIAGAAIMLGIGLILAGLRHKAAKAVEHHQERKSFKNTKGERDDLAAENDRLEAELQAEHARASQPTRRQVTDVRETRIQPTRVIDTTLEPSDTRGSTEAR